MARNRIENDQKMVNR